MRRAYANGMDRAALLAFENDCALAR